MKKEEPRTLAALMKHQRRSNRLLTKILYSGLFTLIAQTGLLLFIFSKLHRSNQKLNQALLENAQIVFSFEDYKNQYKYDDLEMKQTSTRIYSSKFQCLYRSVREKDLLGHNSSSWDFIQGNVSFPAKDEYPCLTQYCRRSWETEEQESYEIAQKSIAEFMSAKSKWSLQKIDFKRAFVRVNQIIGIEYLFHSMLTIKDPNDETGSKSIEKEGAVVIRKGFSYQFCDVTFHGNELLSSDPVYIIVPYTGRIRHLEQFLENIKQLIEEGVSLRLILSVHGGKKNMDEVQKNLEKIELTESIDSKKRDGIVEIVESKGDKHGKFSRSVALLKGLEKVSSDSLVFYCDVDMKILKGFFDNCRFNTWRNEQVYYPIMYSLYPYGESVQEGHGYWRSSSFGMVCAYKSDLVENTYWRDYAEYLEGWGGEDTLLYNGFNWGEKISLFRAPEPNLMHIWHPKNCQWNYFVGSCLNTVFENLGSKRFLGWVVAGSGIDVRSIEYKPANVSFQGFGDYNESMKTDNMTASQLYYDFIHSGKAGLLSKFAKEAESDTKT